MSPTAPLGCAAVGGNMERKNPAGIKIAARGSAIRATHNNEDGSAAASANIWHNSERMTITPACACPARKKFCRSGLSVYPLVLFMSEVNRKYPPYSIV